MTAGEQSNAKGDVALTRKIRRAVVKDHSLSMVAYNVKIVSANGNVTLRGPVNTEAEQIAIAGKARAIAAQATSTINSKSRVCSKEPKRQKQHLG